MHCFYWIILFQYCYYSISKPMSTSRLTKIQKDNFTNLNSLGYLHNGLKRIIPKQNYLSLYPKMKICKKTTNSPLLLFTSREKQEQVEVQMAKIKQLIVKTEAENKQILLDLKKSSKLSRILQKRGQLQSPQSLNLAQAFEIKLLLEVEQLEQLLFTKDSLLASLIREQRSKVNQLKQRDINEQIELYSIIYPQKAQMDQMKEKLEERIQQLKLEKDKIIDKILKTKDIRRNKEEKLNLLMEKVHAETEALSFFKEVNEQNDSGVMTQMRAKTTEEIERQIKKMKEDNQALEHRIQQLSESKIRQKIQIIKQIHSTFEQISPLIEFNQSQKPSLW